MTDRPIIFSGPMVREITEGRKTKTRRLLKRQPKTDCNGMIQFHDAGWFAPHLVMAALACAGVKVAYAVGDLLWVRETFKPVHSVDRSQGAKYRADCGRDHTVWKPAIHMPRWASRLTLEVTAVKVEQLLDITEDDARAEGFKDGTLNDGFEPRDIGGGYTIESSGTLVSAAGAFQMYWAELHPEWDGFSSPWVIAITFVTHRMNIDALRAERAPA